MILGEYWKMHDDLTIGKIDQAAVKLLVEGGARIENKKMLDLLEPAGCRIDRAGHRCYFTEKLIRDAVKRMGGKTQRQVNIPPGWNPQYRLAHGGSHPHFLDWPSGERRLATKQDVVNMAKMAHVLNEYAEIGRVLTCGEVEQRVEPLWAIYQLARITDKKISGGEVFYADYLEPLMRMGEVLSGKSADTSLIAPCDFWIAPLVMDPHQAECFLEKRRLGLETMIGTMPVSGMSSPVTVAGTVTVAVAELLAGWVLGYLVNPALPASGIVASASLDMRTMSACFGSPEAVLQNISTANIASRLYGIPVWAAVNYTDCKIPGFTAAFMKMYNTIGSVFGSNRNLVCDGLLSAGQDYSPVQQMLECEMNKAIDRFWGHYEVNDETIALDLMQKIMRDPGANLLEEEHTFTHYKKEQWYPRWIDRSQWRGTEFEAAGEPEMMKRIDTYCKDAIRRYEQPSLDQAKLAELKKIFLHFERNVLGSNATTLEWEL
ncbi:MAG: trimethylamine methyltransferase family protein [Bacillota bacterium]